jgi:hypothetical protein
VAEDAHITNSRFIGEFYDGILLAGGTPYTNGDTVITGNLFTASGSTANAAIDFEGSTHARIQGNKTVHEFGNPPGNFSYGIYNNSAHPSIFMVITGNDWENDGLPLALGSSCTLDVVSDNLFYQTSTVGPAITCGTLTQNLLVGSNTFVNATGSNIPEAILFGRSPYNSVLMPQAINNQQFAGTLYTLIQSGLEDTGYGNQDYTSFSTSVRGFSTLSSGTITVSTPNACVPGASCIYALANCGLNGSTAIGTLTIGTVSAGTSFVVNSESSVAGLVTTDNSYVCWSIN